MSTIETCLPRLFHYCGRGIGFQLILRVVSKPSLIHVSSDTTPASLRVWSSMNLPFHSLRRADETMRFLHFLCGTAVRVAGYNSNSDKKIRPPNLITKAHS